MYTTRMRISAWTVHNLVLLFCFAVCADDLSYLTERPNSRSELSREEAHNLVEHGHQLVQRIRKSASLDSCSPKVSVPTDQAMIVLGVFGNIEDTTLLNRLFECEERLAEELPPCEYYCGYDFAGRMLRIRYGLRQPSQPDAGKWPLFNNGKVGNLKVSSIGNILRPISEEALLASTENASLRPKLPENIIGDLKDWQIEMFYTFAVYYELAIRGRAQATRDELLRRLLYGYSRDASGDGSVNMLQEAIECVQSQISLKDK